MVGFAGRRRSRAIPQEVLWDSSGFFSVPGVCWCWRLFFFGLVALGLQIALLLISPAQVPVVLYKLALVMLAAILGMFFDVAVFPFATPDSYLDDDWKRAPGAVRLRCADFAIAKGYLWPFVMACLRRAAVVAAFVVAVSVGL